MVGDGLSFGLCHFCVGVSVSDCCHLVKAVRHVGFDILFSNLEFTLFAYCANVYYCLLAILSMLIVCLDTFLSQVCKGVESHWKTVHFCGGVESIEICVSFVATLWLWYPPFLLPTSFTSNFLVCTTYILIKFFFFVRE